MRAARTIAVLGAALAIGSGLPPDLAYSHEVKRTDGAKHHSPLHETVTVAADKPIPHLPGKRLVSLIVHYPPGARSAPHHHARSAFIYAHVLSGEIRSAEDDQPARVYRTGESWFESPGVHHRVSENASSTDSARLLAVFIVDASDDELTIPDPH